MDLKVTGGTTFLFLNFWDLNSEQWSWYKNNLTVNQNTIYPSVWGVWKPAVQGKFHLMKWCLVRQAHFCQSAIRKKG